MKLNALITQYVAFRKSMGEDFQSAESLLKTFSRRMGEDIDLADVSAQQIQAFLVGPGALSSYWRRKYYLLRGLYRYALSRGLVDYAPLPSTVPQAPRFVPYIYTEDELRRLFSSAISCRKDPRKLQPHTLRTILVLLYGAGLRVSEAVALTVSDVDLPSSVLTVRNTKFNKTRVVPIGSQLNQVMMKYATRRAQAGHATGARADEAAQLSIGDLKLAHAPHRDHSYVQIHGKGNKQRLCPLWPHTASELTASIGARAPTEHVFLNRCGRPITRFGIHTLVERYVQRVSAKMPGLAAKRVSPHSIRHTTATHLLRAGVDINTIRAWLGHVSVDTTNIYAETDLEMKAKALACCEVKETKRTKRWRDDTSLMAFLRSL